MVNFREVREYREELEKIDCASFRGARVLITGAGGLIGSVAADALYLAGAEVVAAGRNTDALAARFGRDAGLCLMRYDAAAPLEIEGPVDYIIHAACAAHPMAYSTDPVGVMKANIIGCMNLLEYAAGNGGRLAFLSSGEVYGESSSQSPMNELDYGWIDPMRPRSCYPESKRAAETLCACYAAQYGAFAAVVRLCHTYGAPMSRSNTRADAQFFGKALNGENIVMKSDGSQRRSFLYAPDAVSAILRVLISGQSGEAYNAANRDSVATVREFAACIAAAAGVELEFDLPKEAEAAGYSRIQHAVFDPAKLEGLGWCPAYNLDEGVARTVRILSAMRRSI